MKVRMKHAVRGNVGGHWNVNGGDEIEVSGPVGAKLCEKGFADPVAQPVRERTEKRPAATKRKESRSG